MWTTVGVGLFVFGATAKMGIKTYRKIKRREFFNTARAFYQGGFDPTMNRREAQLILGVREGATPEIIRNAHRKIMVMNHPDAGGSTYIATKVNEAKEILMK